MAEVSKEVLKDNCVLVSIHEFRHNHAKGISTQAMDYAIKHDLIDYVKIDNMVRVIALTEKTLSYTPNKSKTRRSKMEL